MLIYLRGINRNPDANPEDMVSLRLWLTKDSLISVGRKSRKLLSLLDVKALVEQGLILESQAQIFELRDQRDRMTGYIEDLNLTTERAMVLQVELRNRIAEQQGMRIYVLSLVTAIFLPLSFLTGILE